MPRTKTPNRTHRIAVYLSQGELAEVELAVARSSLAKGSFLREIIMKRVRELGKAHEADGG